MKHVYVDTSLNYFYLDNIWNNPTGLHANSTSTLVKGEALLPG